MIPRYPHVAVLGAGTMGAQLACLFAGAGSRVTLLDVDAETAKAGLDRAVALRPSPIYAPTDLARIRADGLDELSAAVAAADWVIEAIVERFEPKRDLLARVDAALPPDRDRPIVTTNTSGLSVTSLAEGRSGPFRRRFFGTHFFNPPRYARLLELVPQADTDPALMADVERFAAILLGKGVVVSRDVPAFIANRLGVHGLLTVLRLAVELGVGPDEADELTGELIGRPKSATFRTLDLVGVDVALAVAEHCHETLGEGEREAFEPPPILRELVAAGRTGSKAGAGFYRKEPDGEIRTLDLATGEYRARRRLASRVIEAARTETDLANRLRILLQGGDAASELLRRTFASELRYAAAVAPDLADDAWSIDAAMRWGFGWQLGPLETIDALGDAARDLLDGGVPALPYSGYRPAGGTWSFRTAAPAALPVVPGSFDLPGARTAAREKGLPSNVSASAFELPDGILGVDLHGKLNIIGVDTLDLVQRAVTLAGQGYDGLVIGTEAADFSAGANLALLLIEAEDGAWDELDRVVRRFQSVTNELRYAPVPVVVAPRGRTLGGGTEFVLAAARAQPLAETYLGLVETGVGLIPAGGGSTAMARRAAATVPEGTGADLFPAFQQVITTIGMARVATSAAEARALWLLTEADQVTANPDRQWTDAARTARTLADGGYRTPARLPIVVLGRRGIAAAETLTYNQLAGRQISEHDRKIVLELARVVSGGDVAEGTAVGEQHLLDLEREAFLRLLGERFTRDRIRHTLKTGKPLRN
ncbi:MAG TPA: 3-hydroxyacyl-CoA dehydrogenase NAD-binding domain-containing protein [Candidatus Sulfomarinibacteraceae bacterium]|nr:3-hydroxyacyl-CoA dehydrogenase NAD-binding domain-containing protein [Candidatus Sulfomarinibacteraceae bacterium]